MLPRLHPVLGLLVWVCVVAAGFSVEDLHICANDKDIEIHACKPDEFFYASDITGKVFQETETKCSNKSMKHEQTSPCSITVPALHPCNYKKSACYFHADNRLHTNCSRTSVDFYLVKDVACIPRSQVHYMCGSTFMDVDEEPVILLSPNYPEAYRAADCQVSIKLANTSLHNAVRFTLLMFYTQAERCGECDEDADYLELDAGNGTRPRRCGRLQQQEQLVFTTLSNITLTFTAGNHRFHPPGFRIQIEAIFLQPEEHTGFCYTYILLIILGVWIIVGVSLFLKIHLHGYDGYKKIQTYYYKKQMKRKLRKMSRVSAMTALGVMSFEETDEIVKEMTREFYNT